MILLIGGLAFLTFAPWVAVAVVVLLLVVVASYRQLIKAYPSGGGDYEVAHKNLGEKAGLVVASALLVDYVITVAVSVASGVDNIISAIPMLDPFRVELAVVFVSSSWPSTCAGVRESSKAFAIPTYLFVASVFVMIVVGLVRTAARRRPRRRERRLHRAGRAADPGGLRPAAAARLLERMLGAHRRRGHLQRRARLPPPQDQERADAPSCSWAASPSCCSPASPPSPSSRMCTTPRTPCHLQGFANCETAPQRSLMAQVATRRVRGQQHPLLRDPGRARRACCCSPPTRRSTASRCSARARPRPYAPKLAQHPRRPPHLLERRHRPRRWRRAPSSLVYQANLTRSSSSTSSASSCRSRSGRPAWSCTGCGCCARAAPNRGDRDRRPRINAFGALLTASVLIVVTITKFTHGAWLVFVIMPILFTLMLGVNRYYRDVEKEIEADPTTTFGSLGRPRHRARRPHAEARAQGARLRHRGPPRVLEAVHVAHRRGGHRRSSSSSGRSMNIQVPLRIVDSPYRDIQPCRDQVHQGAPRPSTAPRSSPSTCRSTSSATGGRRCCTTTRPPHPPEADARARRHRSRSCRGCSTRPSCSTAAGRGRCPARTAAASPCGPRRPCRADP